MFEDIEIYRKAVETYGDRLQLIVANEELSELSKELCKWLRGNGDIEHIAEEFADVEIMLSQVMIMATAIDGKFPAKVALWKEFKTDRLLSRLKQDID